MFFTHFRALFIKRYIYGKRDRRMVCCQLVLPIFLFIIGLCILLIVPNYTQPDIILTSSAQNSMLNSQNRDYVVFNTAATTTTSGTNTNSILAKYNISMATDTTNTIPQDIMSRFNGNEENGVYGIAVPLQDTNPDTNPVDVFHGCAQGATPLLQTSTYLLETHNAKNEHGSSRYGAITIDDSTDKSHLIYNMMINGSSVHGVGIYMNQMHTAYLQVITNTPTARIITHNHPLPETSLQLHTTVTQNAFIVALFAMIAWCFIPASFAVFIVREREQKSKHQQIISGVNIYSYWCSSYAWDILSYLPTAVCAIGLLYIFGVTAYITNDARLPTILLFLINGPATAAFTYMISYVFESHSTAQLIVMFLNFITGLGLMVVSFVLTTIPNTSRIAVSLRYVFRIFPAFCLGDGLAQLALCVDGTTCPGITTAGE